MLQDWAGCSPEHQGFPKLPETHPSWEEKGCGHALAQAGVFGQGVVVRHGPLALVLLQLLQPLLLSWFAVLSLSHYPKQRGHDGHHPPSLLPSGVVWWARSQVKGQRTVSQPWGTQGAQCCQVAAAACLHPARGTGPITIFCPLSSKLTWTKTRSNCGHGQCRP